MSVFFVVALLFAVGAVTALVFQRRRQRKALTQPACGQCGYPVQGLPTFICPECGADLRTVGIVTPGRVRRPLGRVRRAVSWTVLLSCAALLITEVLAISVLASTETSSKNCRLTHPPSGAYSAVVVEAWGQTRVRGRSIGTCVPLQKATLELMPSLGQAPAPTAGKLEIDLASLTCRRRNADGTPTGPARALDATALAEWLTTCGVDAGNVKVQAEIQELLRVVQGIPAGTLFGIYPGSPYRPSEPNVTLSSHYTFEHAALFAFWILVWLIGLWLCVRKRKSTAPAPALQSGAPDPE